MQRNHKKEKRREQAREMNRELSILRMVVVGKCVHSKGARGHFGVMEILFHLDFGGNYINAHICLPKFIELYTEMGYFCCLLITF